MLLPGKSNRRMFGDWGLLLVAIGFAVLAPLLQAKLKPPALETVADGPSEVEAVPEPAGALDPQPTEQPIALNDPGQG